MFADGAEEMEEVDALFGVKGDSVRCGVDACHALGGIVDFFNEGTSRGRSKVQDVL